MKVLAIVQARMSSSRLPGKVLKKLGKSTVINNIVERASRAKLISGIIVATSTDVSDDVLFDYCKNNDIICYRGSLNNVLERFYQCASRYEADIIVRLTGDNALIDSNIIDEAINCLLSKSNKDYVKYRKGLPLGMEVEVFQKDALQKAYEISASQAEKEHVTLRMYNDKENFNWEIVGIGKDEDYSSLRWTMDTNEDYKLVSAIYDYFYDNKFNYEDIIKAYGLNPRWKNINQFVKQKNIEFTDKEYM